MSLDFKEIFLRGRRAASNAGLPHKRHRARWTRRQLGVGDGGMEQAAREGRRRPLVFSIHAPRPLLAHIIISSGRPTTLTSLHHLLRGRRCPSTSLPRIHRASRSGCGLHRAPEIRPRTPSSRGSAWGRRGQARARPLHAWAASATWRCGGGGGGRTGVGCPRRCAPEEW
jgi:hypothetical protein